MTEPRPPEPPPAAGAGVPDRLDSWKEIAAYLKRDVTTVQRWEKREAMPVHRHVHGKMGSVYAFRADLDAWARSRRAGAGAARRSRSPAWFLASAAVVLGLSVAVWRLPAPAPGWTNPLEDARFVPLTDFEGIEQAAAISPDGRFVAFQSDRDGRMDVWVTQVASGRFVNLTRGGAPEIVNPSVRTLGFSPDGTQVTFWARTDDHGKPEIGIWATPLLGGEARPYLEGVAEYDWSGDGARLVYHTPGPGDPMFVREPGGAEARHVFSAPAGLHGHFPIWSPDQAFVYFVQGALPDRLDLWRIRPAGGTPERVTRHDGVVSHPVFLDGRTLLYLANDADGFGPWIYSVDVEARVPRRVSVGIDRYTSLAASADGRRIVATRAAPRVALWRLPLDATRAGRSALRRVPLEDGAASSARLGPGYLVYVSPRADGDGLWKVQDGVATELWSAPDTRISAAPAVSRDGRRLAFTTKQGERTGLWIVNSDGTDARVVTRTLQLRGAPAWTPDGRAVTVAAVVNGDPRLFRVPLDGGAPAQLVAEHALDPAWSSDGQVVAFSGADVGTTFGVRAANADGSAHRLPALTLTRGARHLAFLPHGRSLVVLRGEIRHKNVWVVDLDTGAERQVTDLPPEIDVRDFDVSPDGSELVLEQVQERSDLVLVERPRR